MKIECIITLYSTDSSNNINLIKENLDFLESEFEAYCQNLRNENEKLILLLKKNLQTELLHLPQTIRNMTMEDFLHQCLDSSALNNVISPSQNDVINNVNNNTNNINIDNKINNNNNMEQILTNTQSPTTTQFYNNNKEPGLLSLGELLMTPERPIKNMNEFKQKVISILNSPQLINNSKNKRIIITDDDSFNKNNSYNNNSNNNNNTTTEESFDDDEDSE
ncbi:hypothetical protein DICPUDRAFT_77250 [Dictyostelium purpureum]|uniref:Borealin N-terminal domain-containing protein n=1 Tax=Dictyostelium purpureum TaxID=5786 RepID=F0ZG24_DICPU|nr:uncharacterized protein DICPUDRAFT_77250 [Dictyostelium purpureum]EGC37081.1 hypothetical protein DICPUDRAFT_77250 [Dictyostelium purpureum]|eukprot:XP_003286362.1 hypothetical protein DICPUDRAFT_77250 [Dictyostelium purpureum]